MRVVQRESEHLATTDHRLHNQPFTFARAAALQNNPDEAERVETFVGRFGRLQDTLGDKLLPAYLSAEGESPGTALDRLDRAEQLGLLSSADEWLAMCKLRNQMVHEYIEDSNILADALNTGHQFVPTLLEVTQTLTQAIRRRGWLQ